MRSVILGLMLSFPAIAFASPLHELPIDAGAKSYKKLLFEFRANQPAPLRLLNTLQGELPVDPLERSIALGARSIAWIDELNKSRPADRQLHTSAVKNKGGYPIDAPTKYSPAIIAANLAKWEREAPEEVRKVLITRDLPYTTEFTLDETDFLKINRAVQNAYSYAIRWKAMEPYLDHYAQSKSRDLRGYYFLSRETNLKHDLENFAQLDEAKRVLWREYLIQMCMNNGNSYCENDVDQYIAADLLWSSYSNWLPASQAQWNESFALQWRGTDLSWQDSSENLLISEARVTGNVPLENLMSEILGRVWTVGGQSMQVNFTDTAHLGIEFVPGVLPHYSYNGTIVMDEREDMNDPENQIVLAHEYGHALGFSDCYIEFYDRAESAMVNYQLDVDNLMCSLNGVINQGHFDELKKAY